jgi:hypothetical protein
MSITSTGLLGEPFASLREDTVRYKIGQITIIASKADGAALAIVFIFGLLAYGLLLVTGD